MADSETDLGIMRKSAFDVNEQVTSTDRKIVVALERISESFRVMLWDEAKKTGLSPIQIQIVVFLSFHARTPNTPSYLAKEFNVTKATITDSVRVLLQKGLIEKLPGISDARSYTIQLTSEGKQIATQTSVFSEELLRALDGVPQGTKNNMLDGLYQLITTLSAKSIISVQRMCMNCRYLDSQGDQHYCKFLEMPLGVQELRVDCEEFEGK